MTTKRLRPMALAPALAALALLVGAGCGAGDDEHADDPPAPASSPTLSEEERAAQEHGDEAVQALETLLAEEDRQAAAGPDAEISPVIEQHTTKPYVQQLEQSLGWLTVENIKEAAPETRLLVEPVGEVTAERADVAVCVDTSTQELVKVEDGEPYDDGQEGNKLQNVYELHHLDGEWKVKDLETTLLEGWDQDPCDGDWEA